jgi:hypothetical protein
MADKIMHFEVTESHTPKIDVGFRFDVAHNTSRSLDASVNKALAEELGISENAAASVRSQLEYEEI